MEEVFSKINNLIQHNKTSVLPDFENHDTYQILEDADMYGFSHPNIIEQDDGSSSSVIECFRRDDNWNNPENVSLMMKAYGIDNPYSSICCDTNIESAFKYLEVKKAQQQMFSNRLVKEGINSLRNLKIAESIGKFNDSLKYDERNPRAYLGRAEAYVRLRNLGKAKEDVMQAMTIDASIIPEHDVLHSLYQDIKREVEAQSMLGKRKASSDALVLEEEDREGLVSKIQQSLLSHESSSSSSSSDNDSGDKKRTKSKHKKIKHKKKHKKHSKKHSKKSNSRESSSK
ncbi:hypothetical protein EON65_24820 [archaeon]|nr:MAG: hypothetical protein EON65_24820 [archaeon]